MSKHLKIVGLLPKSLPLTLPRSVLFSGITELTADDPHVHPSSCPADTPTLAFIPSSTVAPALHALTSFKSHHTH